MKLTKSKEAKVDIEGIVIGIVGVIVLFIVAFQIVASTAPDLIVSAGNISESGLPLAGLFSSSGVVLIVFMAGLLIALIIVALKMGKGK